MRAALSVLFVVHWGSVAAYLMPATEAALTDLPAPLAVPVRAVAVPAAAAVEPLASPWLDLTAARQHWGLFAPWPVEWSSSLFAVAYYGEPGGGAWSADTVWTAGPREDPYPHWWDHHRYRLIFNMGFETWGSVYRPHRARWLCRTLRSADGRAPDGVRLVAVWEWTRVPWLAPDPRSPYEQFLGGFTCEAA